ncbi:MAG: hypothetical protein KGJ90_06430 [Patescibacteria group bacterium]|nr:hypothetical protein [Patescibacteria group bacterium]
MKLEQAIKVITELRGEKLSKKQRWDLSKKWRKGLDSASINFTSISINYGGFNGCVTVDGKRELYIGIGGAFRVWLHTDGTYIIDVPNERGIKK